MRPKLVDRPFVTDDHARASARCSLGEATARSARRNDVRPDVTESGQPVVVGKRREAAQPPSGDVLEEDTLDRILGAEVEDLLQSGFDRIGHGVNRRS